jgi:hypothetical protein
MAGNRGVRIPDRGRLLPVLSQVARLASRIFMTTRCVIATNTRDFLIAPAPRRSRDDGYRGANVEGFRSVSAARKSRQHRGFRG